MTEGRTSRGRGAVRLASSLVVALTMTAWLALTAIPASASPATCTFTAGTSGVLDIDLTAGETDVSVVVGAGGVINVVDGPGTLACTGGTPTVTTVDTINVDAPAGATDEVFTIDLSGGPFAPGQTVETTGVSEIEFNVNLDAQTLGGADVLVIKGSSGPDTITFGSSGAALNADNDPEVTTATIELWQALGLGGDDVISGQGGNGTGSPTTIPVGSAAFPTDGGEGNDTISGGNATAGDLLDDSGLFSAADPDDDTLNGFEGPDTLLAGEGNDVLDGGNGNDTENGQAGDDRYFQGTLPYNGADTLGAGGDPGIDLADYSGRTLGLTITTGGGANDGTTDVDFVTPGDQSEGDNVDSTVENVNGGSGDDSITGANGVDNVINGGPGNDTLNGLTEATAIPGDTVDYSNAPGPVTVDLAAGTASGALGNDTLANFESINGSGFDDALTGNASPNRIVGNAGNDTITGAAGDDELFGNDGNDTVNADAGDDIAQGNAGNDTVNGGDGADQVGDDDDTAADEEPGNDVLNGDAGCDEVRGGAGDDTIDGGADDDALFCGADSVAGLFGGPGNDVVRDTGGGDDWLQGDGGDDLVEAGDGDDDAQGNDGRDRIFGGAGDDDLGTCAFVFIEGEFIEGEFLFTTDEDDRDQLFGEAGEDCLGGGNDGDVLDGGNDDDELLGEGGNDKLRGGEGDDSFDGGLGADTADWSQADAGGVDTDGDGFGIDADSSLGFATGEGEDSLDDDIEIFRGSRYSDTIRAGETFSGGDLNIRIRGGRGNDVLVGADGNDVLRGDRGNDILRGAGGEDNLLGNAGNDRLIGGAGNDVLNGGPGTDFGNGGPGTDFCRRNVEQRISCRLF